MRVCVDCGHENGDVARFCDSCGGALIGAGSVEQRRTVTVVFCDLAGSTALGESVDPERLRVLLARYFERMKAIVESHGGTVEKFIGDAVMAVFGVPGAHEDDALRAVRAAVEMRAALPELDLEGRIGVMTGEVVTGTEERLVTGDAVNVAARLEQAAAVGEVLIGEPTLGLVRVAVDVDPVEPLALRGKTEPVAAYRLLAVYDAPERGHDAPFVGRDHELELILDAWRRVAKRRCCELVTVVGEAGIGKTRLVAEALTRIEARVVRGRCLPYGEGITYWPVVEVLKQLDLLPSDESAAQAIRTLLGASEARASADEIAWAFRKTLEHAATEQPLVVVLDDIQWGEETFHDLVEHVALLSAGAPILLLCMARSDLIEHRPTWPVTLKLEPIAQADAETLIGHALPGDLLERIAHAAGGNPLFLTEMLAMAADADGEVTVPPTLRALLEMRLDQLEPAERVVLELGSVEGEVFHRGGVQATAPTDMPVTPRLAALVRKELIRPDAALVASDDGFRFRHLLIRDTAYESLPKAVRAELHKRFAAWFEEKGATLVELDEILGYHFERAHAYRQELGLQPDSELMANAFSRLKQAGMRALRRHDNRAAVTLLERAAAVDPNHTDLSLETELGWALVLAGRADDALRRAEGMIERAERDGDRVAVLAGRVREAVARCDVSPDGAMAYLAELLERVVPELEQEGADGALFVAYDAVANVADTNGRHDEALEALERSLMHAKRVGYEPPFVTGVQAYCRFCGSTPTKDLIAWLDVQDEHGVGDRLFLSAYRAWTLARLGRFDDARTIVASARAHAQERGGRLLLANLTSFESVHIELLAGDPDAAATIGVDGLRMHEELGLRPYLSLATATLAQAFYAANRLPEATDLARRAAELSYAEAVWCEVAWRGVQAKLCARQGEHGEAERLARKAVTIVDTTDNLDLQGDAYADLAEVVDLGGRTHEARAALRQALDRYERKGNIVMARRIRDRLDELRAVAP